MRKPTRREWIMMFADSWFTVLGLSMANLWIIDHHPFLWSIERTLPISIAIAPLGVLFKLLFLRLFRANRYL
jgi:hypothetical protein